MKVYSEATVRIVGEGDSEKGKKKLGIDGQKNKMAGKEVQAEPAKKGPGRPPKTKE